MKGSIERLIKWLDEFLNEDKAQNIAQLERVKRKLTKLKRKSRMLKELIEESHDSEERLALQEELNVASAVRAKAQQKYKELKINLKQDNQIKRH